MKQGADCNPTQIATIDRRTFHRAVTASAGSLVLPGAFVLGNEGPKPKQFKL